MPVSELTITVKVPPGTPQDSELVLVILDEVSDWSYNQTHFPLTKVADDLWGSQLILPARTLLRYRYLRTSPTEANETFTDGSMVHSRVVHISGVTKLDDVIAAWTDVPYAGPTGRILGRLIEAETGASLPDLIAVVGGQMVFTDSTGEFRVDGLPPGLHTITAFSPSGEFSPAQQGALVAADSTTPAQMGLHRSNLVQVTFEVTVPGDTIEGTQLRIAGNLEQFGHLFTKLPGGIGNALSQMPTLIEVDPTHYVKVMHLYAGTDLRYKFTLGDGIINAERDSNGDSFTREVIIPDEDIVIRDSVIQWQGRGQSSVLFWVTVPDITPANNTISLQLASFSPVPMWRIGDYEWFYSVHNFTESGGQSAYRYCRNQLCGIADDEQTTEFNPNGRTFTPAPSQLDLRDDVSNWAWWGSDPTSSLVVPPLSPRPSFEVGVELAPVYNPNWETYLQEGLTSITDMGSNAIILTPSWLVTENNPFPTVGFDPAYSPFRDRLITTINYANSLGLQVTLHPTLTFLNQDPDNWWLEANRDEGWWSVWFERYRSFILYYADIAAETGVAKLILGGEDVLPSLPESQLVDGTSSDAPANADTRWRDVITALRSTFSGAVVIELDLEYGLQMPPSFVDAFDAVHIYWHAPLALDDQAGLAEYIAEARSLFANSISVSQTSANKPITISVEYPSVDGIVRGCPPDSTTCPHAREYDLGADPNPLVAVDMGEQAAAIHAVLSEAYAQPNISGFYVRRYNPIIELQDKSASINGKQAYNLLQQWYLAIRELSP
jgi:hypothetical protein